MIGVFDSGVGGLNSYRELRRLLPDEDIIYLADRKNAPYGTKDRDTILNLTKNNIRALKDMGADEVLIACCTASSVYPLLNDEERRRAVPIIEPAAREAAKEGDRIAVIATKETVRSHAFGKAIERINPCACVTEIPTQILVSLVELGARDGELLPREGELLDRIASEVLCAGADALILGCTHFSSLRGELGARLCGTRIIDAAVIGARELALRHGVRRGAVSSGRVTYTEQ